MESAAEEKQEINVQRIISSVLHQIDVENKDFKCIDISGDHNDLEGYLSDLLLEVNEKKEKRQYDFHRETTEFYTSLNSFFKQQDLVKNIAARNMSSRLLDKEVDTDSRYGHLGVSGKGHVKKGSFLQFLYREDQSIFYLGVKIEHQVFLDEDDFKKKIGLAIARKIFKACKVTFNESGTPYNVFLYDTNPKPSTYWWKDFLELKEVRDDALNTKMASNEVIKVVNRLKSKHPADYTILRNSTIAAFKQKGEMKFGEFVKNTFERYEPVDPQLKNELPSIVEKLKKLPESKKFDSKFNLVPSEVPFKRSNIALSKEISLSINDGIENMEDKIWAEKSANGKKLVVIESPDGFERFKLKPRI